jgi:MFS family permease
MLPGFAGDIYHSDAVGLAYLNSAVGIGAMLSASIVAYRGRITGLTDHAVMGTLGLSIATLGFVVTDWLWLGVIFSALIGFTINTMSTSISALVQSAVDDDMRGRVVSLYVLVFRGTPAIGSLLVGISSDFIGLRWAFVISALICFLAWLVVLPRRRRIAAALEVER